MDELVDLGPLFPFLPSLILKKHPIHGTDCCLSVLQFVPQSVDTGFCNFTQRIEKGLMTALSEVRKHHQGTYNLTVQVRSAPCRTRGFRLPREPVLSCSAEDALDSS